MVLPGAAWAMAARASSASRSRFRRSGWPRPRTRLAGCSERVRRARADPGTAPRGGLGITHELRPAARFRLRTGAPAPVAPVYRIAGPSGWACVSAVVHVWRSWPTRRCGRSRRSGRSRPSHARGRRRRGWPGDAGDPARGGRADARAARPAEPDEVEPPEAPAVRRRRPGPVGPAARASGIVAPGPTAAERLRPTWGCAYLGAAGPGAQRADAGAAPRAGTGRRHRGLAGLPRGRRGGRAGPHRLDVDRRPGAEVGRLRRQAAPGRHHPSAPVQLRHAGGTARRVPARPVGVGGDPARRRDRAHARLLEGPRQGHPGAAGQGADGRRRSPTPPGCDGSARRRWPRADLPGRASGTEPLPPLPS